MSDDPQANAHRCVKMSYGSKKEAQTAMNWRLKARGRNKGARRRHRPEKLRTYFCAECEAWHLTHQVNPAAVKNNWFKKRKKMDFIDDPNKVEIKRGWVPNETI